MLGWTWSASHREPDASSCCGRGLGDRIRRMGSHRHPPPGDDEGVILPDEGRARSPVGQCADTGALQARSSCAPGDLSVGQPLHRLIWRVMCAHGSNVQDAALRLEKWADTGALPGGCAGEAAQLSVESRLPRRTDRLMCAQRSNVQVGGLRLENWPIREHYAANEPAKWRAGAWIGGWIGGSAA